jgi:hypothetical protein
MADQVLLTPNIPKKEMNMNNVQSARNVTCGISYVPPKPEGLVLFGKKTIERSNLDFGLMTPNNLGSQR